MEPLTSSEIDRLHAELLQRWVQLDQFVKGSGVGRPRMVRLPTSVQLPKSQAEEWKRLVQLHLEALGAYLHGLERWEGQALAISSPLPDNKLALSVQETAKVLGISRGSVYEAINQGRIPTIRFGRRLLVSRVALERLLSGEGHVHGP